ncbi:hypothetical protein ACF0H5_016811 [Mactra antiquata]
MVKVFKVFLNASRDIIICFAYLPPEVSSSYNHKRFKGIELLEHFIFELGVNFSEVDFIIMGDLNARTSNQNDYIDEPSNIPSLSDYDDILSSSLPPRQS